MKNLLIISIGLMLIIACCYLSKDNSNTTNQDHGNIIYAASGSRDDIQAAVDSASDGDTILIPEGTFNFGSGYVEILDKLIHIKGAGMDRTILEETTGDSAKSDGMFRFIMLYKTGGPIVSDMKLHDINGPYSESNTENTTVGISLHWGCSDFQIYNMEFEGFGGAGVMTDEYGGPYDYQWKTKGVIYKCRFIDNFMPGLGYGVEVYGGDDKSYSEPIHLGTDYAVFVEDCYFEGNRHHIASGHGSRYVFRYNTCLSNEGGSAIDVHGVVYGSEGTRGSISSEIYGNIIEGNPEQSGIGIRGGMGVIHNNTFKDRLMGIIFDVQGCRQGEIGYPCEYPVKDQIYDLYIWNNTFINCPYNLFIHEDYIETDLLQENRDYFLYEKPGYTPYIYPHPLRWRNFPLNAEINASFSSRWRSLTVFRIATSNFFHIFRQRLPIPYSCILNIFPFIPLYIGN
ncbi:MAG: hypothetical protein ACFFDN_01700 [Candidatus Hodarchaeota archaeon]